MLYRRISRRAFVLSAGAAIASPTVLHAREAGLRFAVGPFLPTQSDTRKAFEPFFRHVAEGLGRPYELVVTNDWAGIAVALANGQVDLAWMGPWGYVLAHHQGGGKAIATVRYDGSPFYHAIILARPGLAFTSWPEDAKGLRISFADVGSTSGWLIPTHYFRSQGIEPKKFFQYRDGASHAANVTAVANGHTDLATDFDRNFNAMAERGLVKRDEVKVVWRSEPLPNDPLVVRSGFDPMMTARIRTIVTSITEEQARTIMPPRYTGWVEGDHEAYRLIETAGVAIGRLRPKS
ncbi:MAG: phosphate/phosphite/phosphonate ABC transporter substrate-binding protein [Caulobacter sp.]